MPCHHTSLNRCCWCHPLHLSCTPELGICLCRCAGCLHMSVAIGFHWPSCLPVTLHWLGQRKWLAFRNSSSISCAGIIHWLLAPCCKLCVAQGASLRSCYSGGW
jgi:hypothetical protein